MSNTNAGFGFLPIRRTDGAMWNEGGSQEAIANGYATAVYRNDVVKRVSTGYIQRAAASDTPLGIFMGCRYLSTVTSKTEWSNYYAASLPASGDIVAFVLQDSQVELMCQLSGAITGFHAGVNASFVATAPSSAGAGLGVETLDSSTFATTSTLPFTCLRYLERVDNDPTATYARVIVKLNLPQQTGV